MSNHQTDRWLIFSDYVLSDKSRPNDVYAYSVMPGGQYLKPLNSLLQESAAADLKNSRDIPDEMMTVLRDARIFTFCFLVDRAGLLPRGSEEARSQIKLSLNMMRQWQDAERHNPLIKRFEHLLREARAKSFNQKLLAQIVTASALAAYITYRVCEFTKVERLAWFSDRDKLTDAYESIANDMYSINVHAYMERYLPQKVTPQLGLNDTKFTKGGMWCDHHLRVPDHFAGTMAVWDILENTLHTEQPKYLRIIKEVIVDNPNFHLVRLKTTQSQDLYQLNSSRVALSSKPF